MKKAIIYCRCSSNYVDVAPQSIEGQKQLCVHLAKKEGFEIIGFEYEAGVNGMNIDRPGLTKIHIFLNENPNNHVIVSSIDRLTRNIKSLAKLEKFITNKQIVCVN